MNDKLTSDERVPSVSGKAPVLAALATITTSLTLVAFGPGLAPAQALFGTNHNEVLVTTRL